MLVYDGCVVRLVSQANIHDNVVSLVSRTESHSDLILPALGYNDGVALLSGWCRLVLPKLDFAFGTETSCSHTQREVTSYDQSHSRNCCLNDCTHLRTMIMMVQY